MSVPKKDQQNPSHILKVYSKHVYFPINFLINRFRIIIFKKSVWRILNFKMHINIRVCQIYKMSPNFNSNFFMWWPIDLRTLNLILFSPKGVFWLPSRGGQPPKKLDFNVLGIISCGYSEGGPKYLLVITNKKSNVLGSIGH